MANHERKKRARDFLAQRKEQESDFVVCNRKVACGVDVVDMDQFRRDLDLGGERFVRRIYTETEFQIVSRTARESCGAIRSQGGDGKGAWYWYTTHELVGNRDQIEPERGSSADAHRTGRGTGRSSLDSGTGR